MENANNNNLIFVAAVALSWRDGRSIIRPARAVLRSDTTVRIPRPATQKIPKKKGDANAASSREVAMLISLRWALGEDLLFLGLKR